MWVPYDIVRQIAAEMNTFNFCGNAVAATYDIVQYVNTAVKSNVFNFSDTKQHRAQCEHRLTN